MKQVSYETIVRCIQFGVPAIAEGLITELNKLVELSNEHIAYLQEQERLAKQAEKEAQEAKKNAEKKA